MQMMPNLICISVRKLSVQEGVNCLQCPQAVIKLIMIVAPHIRIRHHFTPPMPRSAA